MTWESIAIIVIMLSSIFYGARSVYLMKKYQNGPDADYLKEEKTSRIKRNVRTWYAFAFLAIIILFFKLFIQENL